MEGTMRHGFIRADDGKRLRVDHDGFAAGYPLGGRCGGTRVGFGCAADQVEEAARALNVAVVPLFAERRARLRGRC